MDKANSIKEYAYHLGFELCGIAAADPFLELDDFLRQRKARGWESEFEKHDLPGRLNPSLFLPGAQSIIALAKAYPACPDYVEPTARQGKIARCAWGVDYHFDFRNRLEKLKWFLDVNYGAKALAMVDTGPLIERAVAVRAGIGWYGKNCSVISPAYGSWIALGEIVTDVALEPDQPLGNGCGDCEKCLAACPTRALSAPYSVNPNLCLSQITQTKAVIPVKYRRLLGSRIYGCDTCQEVCPNNNLMRQTACQVVKPEQAMVDAVELLTISKSRFREKYGNSALAWRGKNILQRNAVIVLGNSRDAEVIPLLKEPLASPGKCLRGYSAWALGEIGSAQAADLLRTAWQKEPDPWVKWEIEKALQQV